MISRIIEVEVGVMNHSLQLQLMTLNETLIILDITEKLNLHVIVVLLYSEGKNGNHVFASLLTTSNTKHTNLTDMVTLKNHSLWSYMT